jgi:hypothetical protein
LTARIATVSRKTKEALYGDHGPVFDPFSGNMFEVKISATRAMGVTRESEGNTGAMKAVVAGMAAPWLQIQKSEEKVYGSAAVRTKTVRTAALRTDHQAGSPQGPKPKNIQFPRARQESGSRRIPRITMPSGVE